MIGFSNKSGVRCCMGERMAISVGICSTVPNAFCGTRRVTKEGCVAYELALATKVRRVGDGVCDRQAEGAGSVRVALGVVVVCVLFAAPAWSMPVERQFEFEAASLSGAFAYDDATAVSLGGELDGFVAYDPVSLTVAFDDGSSAFQWTLDDLVPLVPFEFLPTVDPPGHMADGFRCAAHQCLGSGYLRQQRRCRAGVRVGDHDHRWSAQPMGAGSAREGDCARRNGTRSFYLCDRGGHTNGRRR